MINIPFTSDEVIYECERTIMDDVRRSMISELNSIDHYRKKIKTLKRGDFFKKHLELITGVSCAKKACDISDSHKIVSEIRNFLLMEKGMIIFCKAIENNLKNI